MNKLIDLLQNKILYTQVLQEYHTNKKQTLTYNFKSDDKIENTTIHKETQLKVHETTYN